MLSVRDVSFRANHTQVLNHVSIDVRKGEFVGLLGPNGSGKSSLLKIVYKSLQPTTGEVFFENQLIHHTSAKEYASKVAVLIQEPELQFAFTVKEVVLMGRLPHKTLFESYSDEDHDIVEQALTAVNAMELSERIFYSLSGGEKQRVLLARAIAQKPKFLILDEFTNHLDIYFQLELLKVIVSLNVTILAVMHDLNFACSFCSRVYVLKKGEVVFQGGADQLLDEELIKGIYNVEPILLDVVGRSKKYIAFKH